MKLAEFAQALRLPEINILEPGEGIQKLGHVAIQQENLFLAEFPQRLAACFSLCIEHACGFGDNLVGGLIDVLCIIRVQAGFHSFPGTQSAGCHCNAYKNQG